MDKGVCISTCIRMLAVCNNAHAQGISKGGGLNLSCDVFNIEMWLCMCVYMCLHTSMHTLCQFIFLILMWAELLNTT